MLVCFLSLHARLRVQRAPGVSCALYAFEGTDATPRAKSRRENADACTAVIASEAKQSILSLRGAMDCFAMLAMTVLNGIGCLTFESEE
jgi:hypothetical protein